MGVDMDNGEATSEILEETVHGGQANMAFLQSDDDQAAKSDLDRERASMMKEHAATIARERYDTFFEGCGMTDVEAKEYGQRMAVWNLRSQHLCGESFLGDLHDDGTILLLSCTILYHILPTKNVS